MSHIRKQQQKPKETLNPVAKSDIEHVADVKLKTPMLQIVESNCDGNDAHDVSTCMHISRRRRSVKVGM